MKANNFNIKAGKLFDGVGYLNGLGDYEGRYSQEAYDVLEIEGELTNGEWCDIMYTDKGKIYAVAGDSEATATSGEFFFKEIFDGVKGDGEILERLGKDIARYNLYYEGTNCVDYSIRWIKLPNDLIVVYNTNERDAYISSEEEIDEAKEDKEQYSDECGYWD